MPFLDDLIGIHDLQVNGGALLPRRSVLNVIGTGVTAVDNPTDGSTDLTLPTATGGATITAPVLSASVNNYSPTGHSGAAVERWSCGSTPRAVTGLDSNGQPRPMIINYGTAAITLSHQGGSSSAANRFVCPGGVDYELPGGGCVELVRDTVSDRWRVVA